MNLHQIYWKERIEDLQANIEILEKNNWFSKIFAVSLGVLPYQHAIKQHIRLLKNLKRNAQKEYELWSK